MRKKYNFHPILSTPSPKKHTVVFGSPVADIKAHMILTDISGKKWRLGKSIGTGGFGEIYLASDNISKEVKGDAQYVAKVETHMSGPLFVEVHCYLRTGKLDTINEWKKSNNLQHLGMPHYLASGSHQIDNTKYRFLILPRYENDLEQMFEAKKRKFGLKTVLTIAIQIIDVLKYIHSKGYVHSDIKASNILFNTGKGNNPVLSMPFLKECLRYRGCTPFRMCKARKMPHSLRPNNNLRNFIHKQVQPTNNSVDQVYLLDYGLATKYLTSNGKHKPFCNDNRKAHAGTILFCSRDAHKGAQSRRSDLECLGYNLIYWLTSDLLWSRYLDDPEMVYKKKLKCLEHIEEFLDYSFNCQCPLFVRNYFVYLQNLDFEEEPDYAYCKMLFENGLKEYGYKNNLSLDFNNQEGWEHKQKKIKGSCENMNATLTFQIIQRSPLKSNLAIKPILRKELKTKKLKAKMNWSKMLMDPEVLLKKPKNRERKITETSDCNTSNAILNLDLSLLNPTSAMIEVFNKSMEKYNGNNTLVWSQGDGTADNFDGYTPAMIDVYNRKKQRESEERKLLELSLKASKKLKSQCSNKNKKRGKQVKNSGIKSHSNCAVTKKEVFKFGKMMSLRKSYSLRG